MKKFLGCLIILALFGGFVFFKGWTQIKIPSDSIGIVVSKLHGIDENYVEKGKFTFHKDFLIPGNAQIITFKNCSFSSEKHINGSLPSGDFYKGSSLYTFDYAFDFQLEAHVTPENILNLMKDNTISDSESLENYVDSVFQAVTQQCAGYYLNCASISSEFIPETITIVDLYKGCRFDQKYPDINLDIIALKSSKIPDYELYRMAKARTIQNFSEQEVTE
ncbi:MAG: hypothetical protein MJ182_05365 [Treponema sp.]|nr:hypothetical protein [Treponema sp.]